MKSMKGFTLIELMIVIAFILILGTIVCAAVSSHNNSDVSFGFNGVVETRCIEGYKVLVSDGGRYGGTRLEQIKDQDGKAIPCAK